MDQNTPELQRVQEITRQHLTASIEKSERALDAALNYANCFPRATTAAEEALERAERHARDVIQNRWERDNVGVPVGQWSREPWRTADEVWTDGRAW